MQKQAMNFQKRGPGKSFSFWHEKVGEPFREKDRVALSKSEDLSKKCREELRVAL